MTICEIAESLPSTAFSLQGEGARKEVQAVLRSASNCFADLHKEETNLFVSSLPYEIVRLLRARTFSFAGHLRLPGVLYENSSARICTKMQSNQSFFALFKAAHRPNGISVGFPILVCRMVGKAQGKIVNDFLVARSLTFKHS